VWAGTGFRTGIKVSKSELRECVFPTVPESFRIPTGASVISLLRTLLLSPSMRMTACPLLVDFVVEPSFSISSRGVSIRRA